VWVLQLHCLFSERDAGVDLISIVGEECKGRTLILPGAPISIFISSTPHYKDTLTQILSRAVSQFITFYKYIYIYTFFLCLL